MAKLELLGVRAIQAITSYSIVSEALALKHDVVNVETQKDQLSQERIKGGLCHV